MKIALVQASLVWGNVEENLALFDRKLAGMGACDVILLPEMFTSGSMLVKQDKRVADAEKNKTAACYERVRQQMSEWAEKQDALIMGSTVYNEGEAYYNRMIVAFPDGKYLYYDKRHCFRMGGENEHFTAGKRHLFFDFRGIRIAAFICYDLRFPVWSRNTDHYDLAVYVANWPASRRKVWQLLLQARAIENQAFVAGVNCVGTDTAGLTYAGDSAVIDAKGNRVGACREYKEEIKIIRIDAEELHQFRNKFAVLEDRDAFEIKGVDELERE